jgi:hypothetical protein
VEEAFAVITIQSLWPFFLPRRFNVLARHAADRKTILEILLDKRLPVYGTRPIPFRIVSTANSSPRLTLSIML